ncbi:MAG: hypothetical protein PHE53_03615 [Thermoguttaceae bacterium]|nr:hypothetical protein [Thermoguttaceae bacterium]
MPASDKKFAYFPRKCFFRKTFFEATNQGGETFCKKFPPELPFQNFLLDAQAATQANMVRRLREPQAFQYQPTQAAPIAVISFLAIGFLLCDYM